MSPDYAEYLAINVLNEQRIVNYRLLSRALKVHSNLAKQMLYEFHRKQNSRKAGSVHATYLLTGTRRFEVPHLQTNGRRSQDGEDVVMQSSPALPSSSFPASDGAEEPTLTKSILLVKEEHLEKARETFVSIASIHIYSLEANGLSDIHLLTECNSKVAVEYATEDPLEAWKQYGTIQNPNVKRRTGRMGPLPAAPAPKHAGISTKSSASTTAAKATNTSEAKPASRPSSSHATPEPNHKAPVKPTQAKRQNSDIFKSFAKAKTKPKQEIQSSADATAAEDQPMGGFSEDEGDAEDAAADDTTVPTGKSKTEREAELQAMMDQEDEEMEDAPTPAAEPDEAENAIDKEAHAKVEEPQETVTVENGRRRGRRRVMKKKTVKDEEGYLVTKEEQAWESFSEDEPVPKKTIKVPPASSVNAASKAAGKKGGKPQGNIMSFFSKK